MPETLTIQAKERAFLPADLRIGAWGDVAGYFKDLLERPVAEEAATARWLKDLSELDAALSEEGGWRYIRMSIDTSDEKASKDYQFFVSEVLPQVEQWTDKVHRRLLGLPMPAEWESDAHHVYLRGIRAQIQLFREANIPLQTDLRSMAQTYGTIMGAMTVEWKGETITLAQAASLLESTDREERELVYRTIATRRSQDRDKLETLYSELIAKRHQVARNADEANYRDYAYKALGRFDHGPADAVAFHKSVEEVVLPLVERAQMDRKERLGLTVLRPWDLSVDPSGKPPLRPFRDPEQLVQLTTSVFEKLDPYFADCLRTMQRMGRLDLGSRKGKAPGGYNYPLYESGSPFIFMNAVGTADDVITMVHEGGHAVHSFLTHPLELTGYKSFPSEVAELASMSMELLTMEHWHLIYPDPEDLVRAKRDQLERVLTILSWVATIDAFQHSVHTQPEMSISERNAEWVRIHRRFSGSVVDWSGLEQERAMLWQKQLHLFEVPFYYIEYAIAQLGAIAVWRNYDADPQQAIAQYKAALSMGYTRTLPEIYAAAGVHFDLSTSYVQELIAFVQAKLEAL